MKVISAIFIFFTISINAFSVYATDVYINNQQEYDEFMTWQQDGMPPRLQTVIEGLKNTSEILNVYFAGGVYKYSEYYDEQSGNNGNRIFISDYSQAEYGNVRINFLPKPGEKVYIVSDGYEYNVSNAEDTGTHYRFPIHSETAASSSFTFIDDEGNPQQIPVSDTGWDNAKGINRLVENTVATGTKDSEGYDLCRIKIPDELAYLKGKSDDYFKNSTIHTKYWYYSSWGRIKGVEGDYLIFRGGDADTRIHENKGLDRFYITNITAADTPETGKYIIKNGYLYIPKTVTGKREENGYLVDVQKNVQGIIYEGTSSRWLILQNAHFAEVRISGLNFMGAANYNDNWKVWDGSQYFDYDYVDMSLIEMMSSENLTIEDCKFCGLGCRYCVYLNSENDGDSFSCSNITIRNNLIYGLGKCFLESTAANVTVDGNILNGTGEFDAASNAITVSGKDYKITNNKISNFYGNAIFVGRREWWQSKESGYAEGYTINGIVEGNELWEDELFWKYPERCVMEDIHVVSAYGHQSMAGTWFRGNVIHDFPGLVLNNGDINNKAFFGDMGAYNVHIIGNLVFNVQDIAAHFTPLAATNYEGTLIAQNNATLSNNVFFAGYGFMPSVHDAKPEDWNTQNVYNCGSNYIAKDPADETYKGTVAWDITIEQGHTNITPDIIDNNAKIENGKVRLSQDYSSLGLSDFVRSFILNDDEPAKPETIAVTGISLNISSMNLILGQELLAYLTATVYPDNATNKNVSWSSSNESIVAVDSNGILTPLSVGKATITATTEDGNYSATCEVTVAAPIIDSNEEIEQSIKIWSSGNILNIATIDTEKVRIYAVNGSLVKQFVTSGNSKIILPGGVYIVVAGEKRKKILIK